MTTLLSIAAFLAFAVGAAHSYLGERYILVRLLRRPDALPRLRGGTEFTARTLRFAWHLTTLAWWGFAAILVLLAREAVSFRNVCAVLAATFLLSGAVTFLASRGRHLAWIVFLAIGAICLYAASVV